MFWATLIPSCLTSKLVFIVAGLTELTEEQPNTRTLLNMVWYIGCMRSSVFHFATSVLYYMSVGYFSKPVLFAQHYHGITWYHMLSHGITCFYRGGVRRDTHTRSV